MKAWGPPQGPYYIIDPFCCQRGGMLTYTTHLNLENSIADSPHPLPSFMGGLGLGAWYLEQGFLL